MSDRRLDPRPREPFGPRQPGLRGWLLRMAQWGLTLTVMVCIYPAVMMVLSAVTAFIPLSEGWRMPSANEIMDFCEWGTWLVLLVLSALRLSGGWYRPWAMGLTGFALGALLYAAGTPQDPEGQAIQLLMAIVAALQLLLHALWSLCVWRNRISQKEE